jgi:integration host factor subunit beta
MRVYAGETARRKAPYQHVAGKQVTKSELIELLIAKNSLVPSDMVEKAVKSIIEQLSRTLEEGGRIEIRGFGSFSLHYRSPRTGRNPKTGDAVVLDEKYVPHFKPGKELRDRVNASRETLSI